MIRSATAGHKGPGFADAALRGIAVVPALFASGRNIGPYAG